MKCSYLKSIQLLAWVVSPFSENQKSWFSGVQIDQNRKSALILEENVQTMSLMDEKMDDSVFIWKMRYQIVQCSWKIIGR